MATPTAPKTLNPDDQWWCVRDAETGLFMCADGSFSALPQDAQLSEIEAWALVEARASTTLEVVKVVMRTVCNTGPFPFVYPA